MDKIQTQDQARAYLELPIRFEVPIFRQAESMKKPRKLRRKKSRPRCKHYRECLEYTGMTLDAQALNCEGCPAYEPEEEAKSEGTPS